MYISMKKLYAELVHMNVFHIKLKGEKLVDLAMYHDMTHLKILFYKVVLKVQGKEVALKGIGWTMFMNGQVCLPDLYLI